MIKKVESRNRKYILLKRESSVINNYSIIPLRKKDIFLIKRWRNEQIDILRQDRQLTNDEQLRYYENVILPSFSQSLPKIVLFSYLLDTNCIGYGGLTNIDWLSKRAELSFLLDTARTMEYRNYCHEFTYFITMISKIAFEDLGLNRVFAETYAFRDAHIAVLEKNGFRLEGRMRHHVRANGQYVDSLIHGLLKEEYLNAL